MSQMNNLPRDVLEFVLLKLSKQYLSSYFARFPGEFMISRPVESSFSGGHADGRRSRRQPLLPCHWRSLEQDTMNDLDNGSSFQTNWFFKSQLMSCVTITKWEKGSECTTCGYKAEGLSLYRGMCGDCWGISTHIKCGMCDELIGLSINNNAATHEYGPSDYICIACQNRLCG